MGAIPSPDASPGFRFLSSGAQRTARFLRLAVGGEAELRLLSSRGSAGSVSSEGGDFQPATFNQAAPPQHNTDDAAMPDAPKHDYDALLRELREEADSTFPGWAEFARTLSGKWIAEQESTE